MMRIASICALLMLAGCGGLSLPGSAPAPSPEFAVLAQQGAPRLQVGVLSQGAGTQVVRQTVRDGFETYVSADGASLTLDRGLLVASRGLGGDMMGSDIAQSQALIFARRAGQVNRFHTFIDGENRAERRAYVCDIAVRGARDVPFGDVSVATTLMAEDCTSQTQQFLNLYWLDRSGRIVQSRQWAGDFSGVLTFRIVP